MEKVFQGTNKEQATRNKELGTRNKEQGTRNKQQETQLPQLDPSTLVSGVSGFSNCNEPS